MGVGWLYSNASSRSTKVWNQAKIGKCRLLCFICHYDEWLSASKGRVSYAISRLDVRDNGPNRRLVKEAR